MQESKCYQKSFKVATVYGFKVVYNPRTETILDKIVLAAIKPLFSSLTQIYTNIRSFMILGMCCFYEVFLYQLSLLSPVSIAEEP